MRLFYQSLSEFLTFIFIIEVIEDYEYYLEYKIIICIQHSYTIALKSIDHYLEHDLKNLTKALKKKEKIIYSIIIGQIGDILLPLSIVVRNISSWLLIFPFSNLVISFSSYYCTTLVNCGFALCFKRMVQRHNQNIHLEKKQLSKQKSYIKPIYI